MALKNPFFKRKHWDQIRHLKNPPFELDSDLHVTIQELVDRGIMGYIEDIIEISNSASKEKKLDEIQAKMKEQWKLV